MGATGTPEFRQRSASAPQVRMRCECKLGNCACEYRFADGRRARRQFLSNCRGRASRVGMVIFESRGQDVK
eukprot:6182278-Pleurochrysis_carterae.AAC.2